MIKTYYSKVIRGKDKLDRFIEAEKTAYNKRSKAFVSAPVFDNDAIAELYSSELGKAFREAGHRIRRVDFRTFSVVGLDAQPIYVYPSNSSTICDAEDALITDARFERIGTKPRKRFLRSTVETPHFRIFPLAKVGGCIDAELDEVEKLQSYLDVFSGQGYQIRLETEVDRLRKQVTDLETRASAAERGEELPWGPF